MFFFASCFASTLPFLTIAGLLIYNSLRGARWNRGRNRQAGNGAYCSSSVALGTILLFAQVFYRPSFAHVVEVRQQEDADEEDAGDPATIAHPLSRQLRQIRRGEPVERLVLQL
jgi:hypothetical protein